MLVEGGGGIICYWRRRGGLYVSWRGGELYVSWRGGGIMLVENMDLLQKPGPDIVKLNLTKYKMD